MSNVDQSADSPLKISDLGFLVNLHRTQMNITAAILLALSDKGILSNDEFAAYQQQALGLVDQIWTRAMDQMRTEFLADNPGCEEFWDRILSGP